METKKIDIKVNEKVETFLKEHPEFEHNLLMGSDEELYVYFPVEQFLKIYKKD